MSVQQSGDDDPSVAIEFVSGPPMTVYFYLTVVQNILGIISLVLCCTKLLYYLRTYRMLIVDEVFNRNTGLLHKNHPLKHVADWVVFFGFVRVPGCPSWFENIHVLFLMAFCLVDRIQDSTREYIFTVLHKSICYTQKTPSDRPSGGDVLLFVLNVCILLTFFLFYAFAMWFGRQGHLNRIVSYRPDSTSFFPFEEFSERIERRALLARRTLRFFLLAVFVYSFGYFIGSFSDDRVPLAWSLTYFSIGLPFSLAMSISMFVLLFTCAVFLLSEVEALRLKCLRVYASFRDQISGGAPHKQLVETFQPSLLFHTYAYLADKVTQTGYRLSGVLFLILFAFLVAFSSGIVQFLAYGGSSILDFLVVLSRLMLLIMKCIPLVVVLLIFAQTSSGMHSVKTTVIETITYFMMCGYRSVKHTDLLVMVQAVGAFPSAFQVGGVILDNGTLVQILSIFASLGAAVITFYNHTAKEN